MRLFLSRMTPPARFIADIMVGKLARWLRILGYDVRYSNRYRDDEIVRLAQSEKRIILTRDARLVERCRAEDYVFIQSGALDAQMLQLIRESGIKPLDLFSRCLECNRPLEETPKEAIGDRVPAYVYQTQGQFRSCPGCQRVYWPGTHGDDVRRRVARWFGQT